MPGGQNDRSHQAVLHARRPPADAAVLREEGPAAAESHGGPHPHVFRGGRGGAGASAAAHPRPRRESGRRRNHHKNETSDGRYAEADRGPSRLRPRERRRREGSRGAEAAGSPGEGGLGAAAARRSLLRKRRKHIMVDERDGRTPPVPDILGILPLRSAVVFPHAVVPLAAGRPSSVRLIEDAAQSGRLVGAVMQRNPSEDAPDGDGLHPVGTLTIIHKVRKQPDGTLRLVVQVLGRFRIVEVIETTPYLRARVESLPEEETPDVETEALTRSAALLFQRVVSLSPTLPDELASVVSGTEPASQVADLITASLPTLPLPLKQELLETVPVKERLQKLAAALGKETEVLELGSKIQSEIQSEMSKTQREYYLREQLKAIQKELGESDERTQEVDALRAKVEAAGMPEEARKEALRELDRLAKMPPAAAEYTVARTYIDGIDKLGMDFRGDPASALLEVLDPEQNGTFRDHYLDVAFDLSRVLFITTANVIDTVPAPLRDRMEVIPLAGYTEEEKVRIAQSHLIPKQAREHGLDPGADVTVAPEALRLLARGYTREAGVRNLEREIANVFRKIARRRAEGRMDPVAVTPDLVTSFLGVPRFEYEELEERTRVPGVAVGLAWTPAGGDILLIEAARMKGARTLTLTGQLGDVMKESAQAALSWVRSHANELGISPSFWEMADIHVHIPAGAIPKDGPSAGITLTTALVSLLTGRQVRAGLAMTGEISLSGRVLPVGGIKEKVLAAHRAGVRTLVLPRRNEKNLLEDVPREVRDVMTIHLVESAAEAISLALEEAVAARGSTR